jgi:ATPase subunit of ABC transporter with duplicated ATPase domains
MHRSRNSGEAFAARNPQVGIIEQEEAFGKGAIMALTLEEMEKRLAKLEEEVAQLKQLNERRQAEETAAERGARLLREAKASQPALSAAVARVFAELGITEQPIGAENVQKMMEACGIKPEDNEFSRAVIEMREE